MKTSVWLGTYAMAFTSAIAFPCPTQAAAEHLDLEREAHRKYQVVTGDESMPQDLNLICKKFIVSRTRQADSSSKTTVLARASAVTVTAASASLAQAPAANAGAPASPAPVTPATPAPVTPASGTPEVFTPGTPAPGTPATVTPATPAPKIWQIFHFSRPPSALALTTLAPPSAVKATVAPAQEQNEEEDDTTETSPWTVYFLASCTVALAIFASYKLIRLYFEFIDVVPLTLPERSSFKKYLQYRFDYWFAWTPGARGMIMLYISVVVVIFGSTFYYLGVGLRIRTSMWRASLWLIDPDAGSEEETAAGAAVGWVMSVFGLIIFAFLLTLLQEAFARYIDSLNEGHSAVVERGHMLLIGITQPSIGILQELCMANAATGGIVIVLLVKHMTKPEMEHLIQKFVPDKMGSRIIVRVGNPHKPSDLRHVAADTASTILLLPDFTQTKLTRDVSMLHSLVTLHKHGWPTHGKLIAVCSLPRNRPIFEKVAGRHALIVILDVFLGRLIVQCTNHFGIGRIVNKTFGFEGSEFYFTSVPEHVVGHQFGDAQAYYPDAVLVGIVTAKKSVANSSRKTVPKLDHQKSVEFAKTLLNKDSEKEYRRVHLCPPMNCILEDGDELVLLAEDSVTARAQKAPCYQLLESPRNPATSQTESIVPQQIQEPAIENILMLGWNHLSVIMLLELDLEVAKGSTVTVMAPFEPASREAFIEKSMEWWDRRLQNITKIVHVQAELGEAFELESLPVEQATRVFILSSQDPDDPMTSYNIAAADACTFTTLLQLEHILDSRLEASAPRMPVVAEIRDTLTAHQMATTRIADFLNLSGVPNQILAMIAQQPRILEVMEFIISDNAHINFAIESMEKYLEPGSPVPEKISFFEVRRMAHKRGDVVIGWTFQVDEKQTPTKHTSSTELQINPPDKNQQRKWSQADDKLIVLSLKS